MPHALTGLSLMASASSSVMTPPVAGNTSLPANAVPTDLSRQASARPVVLISWDGKSPPLQMINIDAEPRFDLLVFDYSGKHQESRLEVQGLAGTLLSEPTECKGDIYQALARHLAGRALPEFVSLIDDDILLSISAINETLHIGRCAELDSFSPCLSHDSFYSHRWTLQRGSNLLNPVDWVEVMMPFYRGELFMAAAPHYAGNVSSYGIDKYLMPTVQKLSGLDRTALVNSVVASHMRPISSGGKVFRNGVTAITERAQMRSHCMSLVQAQAPQLLQDPWYYRIFLQRHVQTRWEKLKHGLGRPLRTWLEHST